MRELTDTEKKFVSRVGASLRAKRKSCGLTLQKLADRSGTTPQSISRLENGETVLTLEWIVVFSTELGCQPFELMIVVEELQRIEMIRLIGELRSVTEDFKLAVITSLKAALTSLESQVTPDPQV